MLIKRCLLILISAIILLSLCSCESKEDRELRKAQAAAARASDAVDQAKMDYEDLSQRIYEINSLQDVLNNTD